MKQKNPLLNVVVNKLRENPPGIFSICSAHPLVLQAGFKLAKEKGIPLLIESTCNQVNQFGGYIGMTPADFIQTIKNLSFEFDFQFENLCLGGDHLGPSLWRNEPAEMAMLKAKNLVRDYVKAGFRKIHLDTSMSCADDPLILPKEIIAQRQAELCLVAEEASLQNNLVKEGVVYVAGTEVPTPGGAIDESDCLEITSTAETLENIRLTKEVFHQYGLDEAWMRTIAFVVQPGVEFSDTQVYAYNRNETSALSSLIKNFDNLVYEAHSTDYQTPGKLKEMVEDHFAILKVGPALTFALREAIFSLAYIERELLNQDSVKLSQVIDVLDHAMVENPVYWDRYYSGSERERAFKRKYSFSDRCRYYWPAKKVEEATRLLLSNLSEQEIPLSLISQFLPSQFERIQSGEIPNNAKEIIFSKVNDVLAGYLFACNFGD